MFNAPPVIIMKQISRRRVLDRSPAPPPAPAERSRHPPPSSFSLMLQLARPVIILQPAINGQEIDHFRDRAPASFDLRDCNSTCVKPPRGVYRD